MRQVGEYIMRDRDEFEEDELQGLLIAYIDDQLENSQKMEIERLISLHDDLKDDLQIFQKSSEDLEEFFFIKDAKSPPHIDEKIKEIFSKTPLQNIKDIQTAFLTKSGQVIGFPGSLRKYFSPQAITQMAAALTVGVFLGPSLFESEIASNIEVQNQPINEHFKTRGATSAGTPTKFKDNNLTLIKDSLVNSSTGTVEIIPGGLIRYGESFRLSMTSPINGKLQIFDVSNDAKKDKALLTLSVEANQPLLIPAPPNPAIELDSRQPLKIRMVFSNKFSLITMDYSFFVSPE